MTAVGVSGDFVVAVLALEGAVPRSVGVRRVRGALLGGARRGQHCEKTHTIDPTTRRVPRREVTVFAPFRWVHHGRTTPATRTRFRTRRTPLALRRSVRAVLGEKAVRSAGGTRRGLSPRRLVSLLQRGNEDTEWVPRGMCASCSTCWIASGPHPPGPPARASPLLKRPPPLEPDTRQRAGSSTTGAAGRTRRACGHGRVEDHRAQRWEGFRHSAILTRASE